MTPEAQRIAIAEACGWKKAEKPKNLGWGESAPPNQWYFVHHLPNYHSDLNSMHEAEKVLTLDQRHIYWQHLQRISEKERMATAAWTTTTATAAQRAEAFLKTIERWEE